MKTKMFVLMDKKRKIVQKGSSRNYFMDFIDNNRNNAKWVIYPTKKAANSNAQVGDSRRVKEYLESNYHIVYHESYKWMIDFEKSENFVEVVELDVEF